MMMEIKRNLSDFPKRQSEEKDLWQKSRKLENKSYLSIWREMAVNQILML